MQIFGKALPVTIFNPELTIFLYELVLLVYTCDNPMARYMPGSNNW